MTEMKRIFLFADIDDNLITSSRTAPLDSAQPIAWDNKGAVCGFLTPKQQMMLDWFKAGCEVVPTTARSTDAYRRFHLPMRRYAITAFGGTILGASGQSLASWRKAVEQAAASTTPVLTALHALVSEAATGDGIDARSAVVSEDGIDMFLSVKHNQRNQEELAFLHRLVAAAAPVGWSAHLNGNFLAVYPPHLGKEKAVRWFIDNIVPEGSVTIGMGDSLTDLPFMHLCDYILMPNGTQNSRALLALFSRGGNI